MLILPPLGPVSLCAVRVTVSSPSARSHGALDHGEVLLVEGVGARLVLMLLEDHLADELDAARPNERRPVVIEGQLQHPPQTLNPPPSHQAGPAHLWSSFCGCQPFGLPVSGMSSYVGHVGHTGHVGHVGHCRMSGMSYDSV